MKNLLKPLVLVAGLFVFSAPLRANNCVWNASTSGSWSTAGNWNSCGSVSPQSGDSAQFNGTGSGSCIINTNVNVTSLVISSGYSNTITGSSSDSITVGAGGFTQGGGTLSLNGSTMTVAGTWTSSGGTFTPGAGTVVLSSTNSVTLTPPAAFNNLTIGNSGGGGASVASGLTGYWKFDEGSGTTATDSSGNGNNGTINGATYSSSVPGAISPDPYSLSFSGSNYVSVSNASNINMTGGSFTMAFWLNAASWNNGTSPGIISKKPSDSSYGYVIYNDGSGSCGGACGPLINFRGYGTSSNQMFLHTASSVSVGNWQHWAAVYDSVAQTFTWYLNGALDTTYSSINFGNMTNTTALELGYSQTWNGYLNGKLDDVRIYNVALSAGEVAELAAGIISGGGSVSSNGLIGYWKLDDTNQNGNIIDSSGQGDNGTASNFGSNDGYSSSVPPVMTGDMGSRRFNGVSDQILVGNMGSFPTQGTIAYWMNASVVQSYLNPMTTGAVDCGAGNGNNAVRFEENTDGTFGTAIGNSQSSYQGHTYTNAMSPNTWYHVALTWNTSTGNVKGYWNGSKVFDESNTYFPTSLYNVVFGVGWCTSRYFNGYLDDIRFYNRALSNAEIAALAAGAGGSGGGQQTLNGTLTVQGDLTLNSSTLVASGNNINLWGNWYNEGGTFTPGNNTVNLSGSISSKNILSGGQAFNNLTVSGSGGWTLNDPLAVNGTLSITGGGTFDASTSNYSVTVSSFIQSAGIFYLRGSTMTVTGVFNDSGGTFTPGSGTVILASTNPVTLTPPASFNNLQIGQGVSSNGLVGYWKFDEGPGSTTATDSSGNGNTGTLISGPSYSSNVPSAIHPDPYSLGFNGSNNYVNMNSQSDIPVGSAARSLSVWVYPNATAGGSYHGIVGIGSYGGTPRNVFTLYQGSDNTFKLIPWGDDHDFGPTITPGQWYHIALTYASGTSTVLAYINGSLVSTITLGGALNTVDNVMTIGKSPYECCTYFNGLVDDLRLYNRVLSAAEVALLAAGNGTGGSRQTLGGALTVNNNFTLNASTLAASGKSISVGGGWSNNGVFTAGGSTVTFTGLSPTLSGNTTFYSLTDIQAGSTMTFTAGSTQTVTGLLTLTGAPGNLLTVKSSSNGSPWFLNDALNNVSYVKAQDSNTSAGNIIFDSTGGVDNTDNTHWVFYPYTWIAPSSSNWNNINNWGGGVVPGPASTATFSNASVQNCTIDISTTVSSLTINSGYTGVISLGGSTLTVAGNFSDGGGTFNGGSGELIVGGAFNNSGATFTPGTGTVILTSTNSVTLTPNGQAFNNLVIGGSTASASGLVGYWKFDEGPGSTTATDSSGNGNTGTINGATYSSSVPSAIAADPYSLNFNGASNSVQVPASSSLNITGNIAVSVWVRYQGNSSSSQIISKEGYGTGYYLWIDGSKKIHFGFNGGGNEIVSSSSLDTNWHHVVCVFNGSGLAIYLDGGLNQSGGSSQAPSSTGNVLYIGRYSGGNYFSGYLDDFRIYNRALSPAEVAALAAGGGSRTSQQILNGTLVVQGDLTLSSGILVASGNNIDLKGSWTDSGGLFVPEGNSVILNGNAYGKNILSGGQAFNNLTINGSGGYWTMLDPATINGALTVQAGTFDTSASSYSITELGNFIQSGGIFKLNASTMSVAGSWSAAGGTFNAGTSTVTFFNSTSGLSITSHGQAFNNLVINAGFGGGWTFFDPLAINNNLTLEAGSLQACNGWGLAVSGNVNITGGTLYLYSSPMTVGGNWTYAGGGFVAGTSTVTFNGTGLQNFGPGGQTFIDIAIGPSSTLSLNANDSLTVGGNWTNNGAFTGNSGSTVTFNGGTDVLTGSSTFYNLADTAAGGSLVLPAGSTQTVRGLLTLNGVCDNLLAIQSTNTGTYAYLNNIGTTIVSKVAVTNIYNAGTTITAGPDSTLSPVNLTGWNNSGTATCLPNTSQPLFFGGN